MYLSRLELFGFKSFAQRINVKFDSGLTAIVGPNGCGKTNIVDAIRWALGEQKSSTLRSDKMENVIFNGTKSRKPLGMSEVSITIENTKNILPTEYSEVTVTRRLYRNGDSEYLLNKVPCRLKDITDLFADTGMGSDAYSVIELKMIEQILSENAEERRKLFEEAAGITKYKQRRKQTFKKLETTSQDLSRVQDIVLEVEKKVASLERQAKKAEQAKQVKTELKQLEIEIAERGLRELREKIEPLVQTIQQHEQHKGNLTAQLDSLDADIQKKLLDMVEMEKRLSAAQKDINQKAELITATEKQILANEERRKSLAENIARARGELTTHQTRLAELQTQRIELETELLLRLAAFDAQKQSFEQDSAAFIQTEQSLREERAALEQKRAAAADLSKKISSLQLEAQSFKSRLENLSVQSARNDARKTDLSTMIAERASQLALLSDGIERVADALTSETAAFEDAKSQRAALQQVLEQHKETLLKRRADLNATTSRIEFLQSLLESYEGLPEGVKFLENDNHKRFGLGSLADLISIDESDKLALAAALGEAQTYYVSRTASDALAAISKLQESEKGKLTFVVLEKIAPPERIDFTGIDGARRISDLVRCADDIRPVIDLLLSNTFVVETLAQAAVFSEAHPHVDFVTRAGERLSARGLLRGGSVKESEGLRIGKREELERLAAEKATLADAIHALEADIAAVQNDIHAIDLSAMERRLREMQQGIIENEKRLAQVSFEKASFEAELTTLDARLAADRNESEKFQTELSRLHPEISMLELSLSALQSELQEQLQHIAASEHHVQVVGAELQQKNLALKESEFGLEKLRSAIQVSDQEHKNATRQIERLTTEIEQSNDESFRLSSELETMNANLRALYAEKDAMQHALNDIEVAYTTLKSDLNQNESRLRDLSRQRDVLLQMILEFQQQLSQAEVRAEHLRTVIKTEYDVELADRMFSDADAFDRDDAASRVQQLKNKLKSLGLVNELALEEFEDEKKRLDFLTTQRADLLDAEKQLRDTIHEINKTAEEQFSKTFAAIRQNFISIFRELFNDGDEADLMLQESDDPLEANIDVIAKPKGKRPQSIMLLSGGEKTLTATALLFAIYLVKPSPFCILDEVDAPLDDANVDRFVKLLAKFASDTQFIIVTHNKRTMEACRTLYGVTMEEEGVSKLVSVKFNDAKHN